MKIQDIKNIDNRLHALMVGWFINSLGFGAVVPFMTVYFHTVRGVSMTHISLFFLAAAICRTVSQSIGGSLSDRIGRKGLMVWSQLSRSLIFLLAGLTIRADLGIWVLAGILLSQYLISSFFQPVASAMIADILPAKKRSGGYALMRMAGNIGWGAGPAIGGFLFDVSYDSLFFFTAVAFLVSGLFVVMKVKETTNLTLRQTAVGQSTSDQPTLRQSASDQSTSDLPAVGQNVRRRERQGFAAMAAAFKQDRVFLFFCIVTLFLFLTWGQFISTLSVYMSKDIGLSSSQIGWLYTFNSLLVIVFQLIITHTTRKKNHFVLMMIGTLLFALSYSLMGWMSSFIMMMIVMVFITFGEMFAGPTGNTIASNMARNGQFGRYQGIYSSISTLGWSLGPFIGGILMDLIPNMKIFWLTVSSFGLLAFFGYFILYMKTKEKIRNENMD